MNITDIMLEMLSDKIMARTGSSLVVYVVRLKIIATAACPVKITDPKSRSFFVLFTGRGEEGKNSEISNEGRAQR